MFIGIDLGTSAVKLIITDERGNVLKTVSKEYGLSFPHPGWSEQRPEDWYDQTILGIKELIDGLDAPVIDGIGVGGQMHGLVVLDKEDRVLRPAILWNDGRTVEETDYLNNEIGKSFLSEHTGNIAFAGFTAPKILWMKKNEPELFSRISKIMLPKDYLVFRLTGSFVTDYSDASGMLLLDVSGKCWSPEMLDICGITEKMLPRLCESFEVVGEMKTDIKESLGLSGDVKFVAGAGDNASAAVGTGTVGAGHCNISLGTSGTVFITNDRFVVDGANALHSFAHADGGYHLMACMLSAASCNKWWMDEILKEKNYAGSQSGIEKLGENNVYFLPYLMGERSPWNDPAVRACFFGMSMDTSREDMIQAVLEGVAFGLRDSMEIAKAQGITLEESTICGGGAKSPLWRRILANVLGIRISTLKADEGPALGGAILAAVGCGCYSDVESAARQIVRINDTIEPNPELVKKYNERYEHFKKLYPAVKDIF